MTRLGKLKSAGSAAIVAFGVASAALAQTPGASSVAEAQSAGQADVAAVETPAAAEGAVKVSEVFLSLCVEKDGSVSKAELAKNSGNPRLDQAALNGIKKLKFTPAKNKDGKPIRMCNYRLVIEWRLPE